MSVDVQSSLSLTIIEATPSEEEQLWNCPSVEIDQVTKNFLHAQQMRRRYANQPRIRYQESQSEESVPSLATPPTPPSYSVVQLNAKDQRLYTPLRALVWPQRPKHGPFSSKQYWTEAHHVAPPHVQSVRGAEHCAKHIARYRGVMTSHQAGQCVVRRTDFMLYHLRRADMPLMVVYKTCLGEVRHYPVMQEWRKDDQSLYFVDCSEPRRAALSSIEALVNYHQIYGYVQLRRFSTQPLIDVFPWWIDDEHYPLGRSLD